MLLKFKKDLEDRQKNKGQPQDEFGGLSGPEASETQDMVQKKMFCKVTNFYNRKGRWPKD